MAVRLKPGTQRLLKRLGQVDFLVTVGQPLPKELAKGVLPVSTWEEAVAYGGSPEWGDYCLQQQNRLSGYVWKQAPRRFQRWNELVDEVRQALVLLVETRVAPRAKQVKGKSNQQFVVDRIRSDLLLACMEMEFADLRQPSFFNGLVEWYVRGRFPCGWGKQVRGGTIRLLRPIDQSGYDPANYANILESLLAYQLATLLEPHVKLPQGRLLVF